MTNNGLNGFPSPVSYASKPDPLGHGFPYTVDPRVAGALQTIGSANRAIFLRCTGGGTISKIGLFIGASSGNIDVGVYSNTGSGRNARPAVRYASSGATACPTGSAYAEVSLAGAVAVQSGDWLAVAADNNTVTFAAIASQGAVALADGLVHYLDSGYTLPPRATITGSGMRAISLVGV